MKIMLQSIDTQVDIHIDNVYSITDHGEANTVVIHKFDKTKTVVIEPETFSNVKLIEVEL